VSTRRPLYGWLTASIVSLCGTRLSMIAVPWFVLTTTGSATSTGLIGFAEMLPYVAAKAAGGPLIDRVGARRVSVSADVGSTLAVVAIPALHLAGMLSMGTLAALVASAGMLRGPGDGAKSALIPSIATAARAPVERVTGLGSAVERLATTAGSALAGALVALIGPINALVIDAASFAVAALLIAATNGAVVDAVRAATTDERYLTQLRAGWRFLRSDAVLVAMVVMVGLTNLVDQAYTAVLVPVWALHDGGGAGAIGLLFAVFAAGSTVGSLLAATVASGLPRFPTYVVAFLIAGGPRFAVLALGLPVSAVLVTAVVCGFASGFINPILGALVFERVPSELVGRVSSLNSSLCWSLIPFGSLVGGALVATAGLVPALLLCGAAYFAVTMLPTVRPEWRSIDVRAHREQPAELST
jgi:MFS family permease